MTKINEIIEFLSYVSVEGADKPNLSEVLEIENIALPLAFAVKYGFATLTKNGESELRETYDFFAGEAEARGLDDIYDIVDTETPIQPRRMTISIDENGKFV